MQNRLVHHLIGTKLRCVNRYRTTLWFACSLSTTKVLYLYTSVVCSCAPPNTDKKCPFFACSLWPTKKWPPHLPDIGPPCAPWCTTQVGGAQCRSVVHNVVLYPRGGSVALTKPKETNRCYPEFQTYCLDVGRGTEMTWTVEWACHCNGLDVMRVTRESFAGTTVCLLRQIERQMTRSLPQTHSKEVPCFINNFTISPFHWIHDSPGNNQGYMLIARLIK